MNRRAQRGFGLGLGNDLSDYVILLAIVVILAVIAVPQFLNLRKQQRVAEAVASLSAAKAAMEGAFAAGGPADMSQKVGKGWAPSGAEHVLSAAIGSDGTITLLFADSIAPQGENVLQIVPVSAGTALDLSRVSSRGRTFEWQCGGPAGKTTLPEEFRPEDCR